MQHPHPKDLPAEFKVRILGDYRWQGHVGYAGQIRTVDLHCFEYLRQMGRCELVTDLDDVKAVALAEHAAAGDPSRRDGTAS